MSKTTLVQVRVDEKLKSKMDRLFSDLGMDTSTAVRVFFKQAEMVGGMPFDVRRRFSYGPMSREQLDVELQKGLDDLNAGRTVSLEEVREKMKERYGEA